MPRQNQIQFRKGTGSQWSSSNPVLNSGEPGYETDSSRLKIGLGLNWDDTSYIGTDSLITTVYNKTGSTISGFNVVHISGGHGNIPAITLSIANSEMTSSKTFGITINDIPTNSSGLVITNGSLKRVDTNKFGADKEGFALWLSPTISGGITLTKPYAPDHSVFVGTILRSHSTQGVVEVKIQNGYELEELHNVATTGVTSGQFLQYNSGSGLWVPSSSGNFSSLNVNNTGVVVSSGASYGYLSRFISSNTIDNSSIYQESSNKIRIGTNGVGYVVISDDSWGGELGILTQLDEVIAIKYQDGSFRYGGGSVGLENIVVASGGNVGIGTDAPTEKLTVNGNSNFTGNLIVGGNFTVNGTTVTANVDNMTIEDPIITLGLASGNIVTNDTLDRGLALVRATGLTAFMGWDSSASQFVMLSSGVGSNSSGNYDAGTYGDLQINNLNSNIGNFSNSISIGDGSTYGALTIGYSDIGNLARFARISNNPRIDLNGTVYFGTPAGAADPVIIAANGYNGNRGAITSGVWRGDTIEIDKGGTGRSSYSNGQLLIGSGTSLVANTLTATSGIGITNGSGTITVGVTGIPSSTITNFNSSVSGLLPTIANSGDNRILTSTGSSVGINAESDLTFDGTSLSAPRIIATQASADEGGELQLAKAPNSSISGAIIIDAYQNRLRFFEQSGSNRGFYLDLSAAGAGVSTNIGAGGGGSATTVSNYADNRIITSDGTTTGLNAESNFTFNGSLLNVTGSGSFSNNVTASGSFIAGSGSANNPSFEFIGDPDTGLFSTAANTIGLATSGVERLRVDSIGNVGIGTAAPSAKLDIAGTLKVNGDPIGNEGAIFDIGQNSIGISTYSGPLTIESSTAGDGTITIGNGYNDTTNLNSTYTSINGNVGIGIASPTEKLEIDGIFKSTGFKSYGIGWFGSSDGSVGLGVNDNPAGTFGSSSAFAALQGFNDAVSSYNPICLTTQNAPQLYLNTDGNVGIGTATPSAKLDINGNVNIDGNLTFDSFTESVVAIGNSSTSKTINLTSGTVQTCTLTANCTFTMPTATAGKSFTLFLNTGTGGFTATFTGVRWSDSTPPTITSTASKVDLLSFISDGTYWYGSFSQNYG